MIDLSNYKDGNVGCRWRSEKEVVSRRGEKTCAEVNCRVAAASVYEMNFGYLEEGKKKNALVKVAICKECSEKLSIAKKKPLVPLSKIKI
jgi:protein FRA10AC1